MRAWASEIGCGLPMEDRCRLLAASYYVAPATVRDVLENRSWYDPLYEPESVSPHPVAVLLALVRTLST